MDCRPSDALKSNNRVGGVQEGLRLLCWRRLITRFPLLYRNCCSSLVWCSPHFWDSFASGSVVVFFRRFLLRRAQTGCCLRRTFGTEKLCRPWDLLLCLTASDKYIYLKKFIHQGSNSRAVASAGCFPLHSAS